MNYEDMSEHDLENLESEMAEALQKLRDFRRKKRVQFLDQQCESFRTQYNAVRDEILEFNNTYSVPEKYVTINIPVKVCFQAFVYEDAMADLVSLSIYDDIFELVEFHHIYSDLPEDYRQKVPPRKLSVIQKMVHRLEVSEIQDIFPFAEDMERKLMKIYQISRGLDEEILERLESSD